MLEQAIDLRLDLQCRTVLCRLPTSTNTPPKILRSHKTEYPDSSSSGTLAPHPSPSSTTPASRSSSAPQQSAPIRLLARVDHFSPQSQTSACESSRCCSSAPSAPRTPSSARPARPPTPRAADPADTLPCAPETSPGSTCRRYQSSSGS